MTTATLVSTPERGSRALHVSLWVAQILLALVFLASGGMKVSQPYAVFVRQMGPDALSEGLIRFIGISELLGAVGLILPAATRVKPGLTALAAVGITLIMVLASLFHLSRGEAASLPIPIILGGLAVFVAWGRWRKAPIAPR